MCRGNLELTKDGQMKVLVIGLGSMGSRRIRNLQSIGGMRIFGFDISEARARQVCAKYDVELIRELTPATLSQGFDAVVISTSPDWHMHYAEMCVAMKLPVFIEASVVETDRVGALAEVALKEGVLVAASCTMRFFEGPKLIANLINGNSIGKPLAFTYHTGQWLEDWHPWEDINDFYVSKREMGGGREIVPFELTWLNDIFGFPTIESAHKTKCSALSADIDDLYQIILKYPGGLHATMVVEILSRPRSSRELRIVGDSGIIVFSGDDNLIRISTIESPNWKEYSLDGGTKFLESINPDEPYKDELEAFLRAVEGTGSFPNTLSDDYAILNLLDNIDRMAEKS